MSSLTKTVRLHRVLRAPPERVYRAVILFRKVACGTELEITQEGFPLSRASGKLAAHATHDGRTDLAR